MDKKPNVFVRMWKATITFFKEVRGELKKVVWPTYKQVVNNTIIVIVAVLLVGALITVLDLAFSEGLSFLTRSEETAPEGTTNGLQVDEDGNITLTPEQLEQLQQQGETSNEGETAPEGNEDE